MRLLKGIQSNSLSSLIFVNFYNFTLFLHLFSLSSYLVKRNAQERIKCVATSKRMCSLSSWLENLQSRRCIWCSLARRQDRFNFSSQVYRLSLHLVLFAEVLLWLSLMLVMNEADYRILCWFAPEIPHKHEQLALRIHHNFTILPFFTNNIFLQETHSQNICL